MSILQNSQNFLINTNILLFQNKLFLKNNDYKSIYLLYTYFEENFELLFYYFYIKSTINNTKTTIQATKTTIQDIITNREKELHKLIKTLQVNLKTKIEIINNKSGEITKIENYNILNSFKKNMLDNRFISHILVQENYNNSLFITLTTQQTTLSSEIEILEEQYLGIKKILKKHKVKYIKNYELTKNIVPHIHLLIFDTKIKEEIQEYLNNFNNKTQILNINKKDLSKVANYITKNVNNIDKTLISFDKYLKLKKIKLFSSSQSKIFEKKQRNMLFNAYKIHIKYSKKEKEFTSNDFINFCLKYVKNPLKGHNLQLKNTEPHFIIEKQKIYHSSNLQVFSKYSRVTKNEKRSVILTHKFIIDFSKILLNKVVKKVHHLFINLFNFDDSYIIYYIVNYKIIIIKPPP